MSEGVALENRIPAMEGKTRLKGLPFAAWLVVAMTSYQWFLCFVSTNIASTSSTCVAIVEALVIAVAAVVVLKSRYALIYILLFFTVLVYFAAIGVVRGEMDPQDIRNILIPLTFFFLGKRIDDRDTISRLFWFLSCFVLVGAIGEYFFTSAYLKIFNIQHYYADRGYIQGPLQYINSDVLFNGERFTGRNILPFLGNQRISSLFLEPVSMGNFATLLAAWGLSFQGKENRLGLRYMVMAAVFIVASDSRFSSMMFLLLMLVKSLPLLRQRRILFLVPIGGLILLLVPAYLTPQAGVDDNLHGRIVRSGAKLAEMDLAQWLGVGKLEALGDMGVAFTIDHMGILMAAALAWVLALLPFAKGQPYLFRAMVVYYATGILMISGTSFYSSKTAALMWFALGALAQIGKPQSVPEKTGPEIVGTAKLVSAIATFL